jgi:hypothetical protein
VFDALTSPDLDSNVLRLTGFREEEEGSERRAFGAYSGMVGENRKARFQYLSGTAKVEGSSRAVGSEFHPIKRFLLGEEVQRRPPTHSQSQTPKNRSTGRVTKNHSHEFNLEYK